MQTVADFDVLITKAQEAAAALASRRKEVERGMRDSLARGGDKPAREAAAEFHRLTDDLEFEEQRVIALREARAAAEASEAADALVTQRAKVKSLAAKRVALAESIEADIQALAGHVASFEAVSSDLDTAVASLPDNIKPGALAAVRPSVINSLISSGMPWVHPNGMDALNSRSTFLVGKTVAARAQAIRQTIQQACERT